MHAANRLVARGAALLKVRIRGSREDARSTGRRHVEADAVRERNAGCGVDRRDDRRARGNRRRKADRAPDWEAEDRQLLSPVLGLVGDELVYRARKAIRLHDVFAFVGPMWTGAPLGESRKEEERGSAAEVFVTASVPEGLLATRERRPHVLAAERTKTLDAVGVVNGRHELLAPAAAVDGRKLLLAEG